MASTNKTEHLQLNQWAGTDPFRMADFNEDNAKIDAAVQANTDAIASNTQAIAAVQSSALRVATGSYTGNGNFGSSKPNTLTFDFEPKLVIIRTPDAAGSQGTVHGLTLVRGTGLQWADTYGMSGSYISATWGTNSVSWYASGSSAGDQCNQNKSKYFYVAFG